MAQTINRREVLKAGLTAAGLAMGVPVFAQQQTETIIRNGLIVNESGRMEADVRIRGEKIAEIGRNLAAGSGAREIEAQRMLLLPGAVDTHTHLIAELPKPPQPNANTDDYASGSSAALAGGATTISNFIPMLPGEEANAYADRVIGQIQKTGIADFFIHVNMGNDPAPFTRAMFDKLADRGFVSTGEDFLARASFDEHAVGWYKAFKASGQAGVLSMLHCEDYPIMAEAQDTLMAEGKG